MYQVIHQRDLPQHFFTNPTTIHFFLVHYFKKYFEKHNSELMSQQTLQKDCKIVSNDNPTGEIATLYYQDAPIVRLVKKDDEHEIHVLQDDVPYEEARRYFSDGPDTRKTA